MSNDPEALQTLLALPNEIEAGVIVGALEQYGIPAFASGGITSGFKAEAPGDVKVLVKAADLVRARQALADIRSHKNEIDWDQVDVGSPEEFGTE